METDLLIVGGGINGAGIARDAAGRGLRVVLAEQGDLGGATSSASSKLIHGGLRYLEHLQFRLVAESLREREVLLRTAPHLVYPMRFVMPQVAEFRAAWMVRAGLFLYDALARGDALPRSTQVNLRERPYCSGLKREYTRGYAYSDCGVDDARLVVANARAAADLGAHVMPRTTCVQAERVEDRWRARLNNSSGDIDVVARGIVNAAGPWADRFLAHTLRVPSKNRLRLVQGSHIVVSRLYDGEHAFIIQNDDGRIIFVYPYEYDYTLIGTTELELEADVTKCETRAFEVEYLCKAVNRYFAREVSASDVTWSYCGIRALVDDGAGVPSKVTRDYRLDLDADLSQAPLLSVLGGKITTYRKLAERALAGIARWFPGLPEPWTARVPLPGGDLPGGLSGFTDDLVERFPSLPRSLLSALARRHGSRVPGVLGSARNLADLGNDFGGGLYAREIDYFMEQEWAQEAEDVLWRRTKTGLHLSREQQGKVRAYMARRTPAL